MASIEDLIFSALGGTISKPDFAAGDPYAEPGQFVESALTGPILQAAVGKGKSNNYSTGELIGAGLLTGLLGGGLEGLSTGYQTEQKSLYNDALRNAILSPGKITAPEGLEPSLFDNVSQYNNIFDVAQAVEKKQLLLKAAQDVQAGKLDIIKSGDIDEVNERLQLYNDALLGKQREAQPAIVDDTSEASPLQQIRRLPKALEGEARKELTANEDALKMRGFAEAQFDAAKNVPSLMGDAGIGALFPGSTASNQMDGIAQGLRTTVQKFLGREMNGPEQERFLTMLPDWNDSQAQIDDKKTRYIEMLDSMMPSTPILKESNIIPREAAKQSKPAVVPGLPPGYEYSGKTDSQGRRGIKPISRGGLG